MRSYRGGTLSLDDIRHLIPMVPARSFAIEELDEFVAQPDGFGAADVCLHEGDLHVDGDLDTAKPWMVLLVVRGNLTVTGAFLGDHHDAITRVIVTGDMRARDVVTAGLLSVHGDLSVERSLIGDDNHGRAIVGGDVSCELFYPEEHYFSVGGAFRARHLVGKVRNRLRFAGGAAPDDTLGDGITLHDQALLELFDPDLLQIYEEEDGVSVDGFRDGVYGLKRRIRTGRPLRTSER